MTILRKWLRRLWPQRYVKPSLNEARTYQVKHAKNRASERFNLKLTDKEYWTLVRQIQDKESEFVEERSRSTTLHRVTLPNGRKALAVYSRTGNLIKSFLYTTWAGHKSEQPNRLADMLPAETVEELTNN